MEGGLPNPCCTGADIARRERQGGHVLAVISPAKSLDFDTPPTTRKATTPRFLGDAATLIDDLAQLAPGEISDLMGVSTKLGELNCDRYNQWRKDTAGAKQAALAFTGDVYRGLQAWTFNALELNSLQRRVRILSGLYGLLRPLDAIHPHRLEMGTRLATARGKDLYAFWGDRVTTALNEAIAPHRNRTVVNLASKEYWSAVRPEGLDAKVLGTRFLDRKNGAYKMVSFFAKRARGLMAGYIARHKVETAKALKAFDWEGYRYSPAHSHEDELTFVRDERP